MPAKKCVDSALGSLAGTRPERGQGAAAHEFSRQGMADNLLGELGGGDQFIKIDASLDTHFLGHEHQVFGTNVTRGTTVAGKRTAAEAGTRRIKNRNPHGHGRISIGQAGAACVVQVKGDGQVGPTVAYGADGTKHGQRVRVPDSVGEGDAGKRPSVGIGETKEGSNGVGGLGWGDIALEVAAEGGHHEAESRLNARFCVGGDQFGLMIEGLLLGEAGVIDGKRLRGADLQGAVEVEGRGPSTFEAPEVEPEPGVGDTGLFGDCRRDVFGVGHLRHFGRVNEGDAIDLAKAGLGQGIDQSDPIGDGFAGGFDLKALTGAFLVNDDGAGQVRHAHPMAAWKARV